MNGESYFWYIRSPSCCYSFKLMRNKRRAFGERKCSNEQYSNALTDRASMSECLQSREGIFLLTDDTRPVVSNMVIVAWFQFLRNTNSMQPLEEIRVLLHVY